uniref:Uncharacterized protein n=1 Tax=Zea mays TaxID=4577 RepID=C0PBS8_MAIZE|nr:unknown [Zea mays]
MVIFVHQESITVQTPFQTRQSCSQQTTCTFPIHIQTWSRSTRIQKKGEAQISSLIDPGLGLRILVIRCGVMPLVKKN